MTSDRKSPLFVLNTSHSQAHNPYFITRFKIHVQTTLDELCREHGLQTVNIKNILVQSTNVLNCRKNFSLLLKKRGSHHILPLIEELAQKLKRTPYIFDYHIENSNLMLHLNRPIVFRSVLHDINLSEKAYGLWKSNRSALVLIHSETSCNLTNLRRNLVAEHLISLLAANGFNVYYNGFTSSEILPDSPNLKQIKCSDSCVLTEMHLQWEEVAKSSKWKVCENDVLSALNTRLVLDGRHYLQSNSYLKHYDKNIGYIYVRKDDFTDYFRQFVYFAHVLKDHLLEVPDYILHIIPKNKELMIQQSGILLEMLYKSSFTQLYIIHQTAHVKNKCEGSVNDYMHTKSEELEAALIHKYGPHVIKDEIWKSCIKVLTNTTIKFDFLLTSLSVHLKLEQSTSQNKGGTFVQYNYARLSMLFKRYEQKVSEKYYDPLPPIVKIDFGLLTLEEEWSLLFNYILPFPNLIHNILEQLESKETVKLQFLSHKICQMLVNISRDLSTYYSRTRILSGPQTQLQNIMAARLYLLKSVHQVIKIGLTLLNIEGLEQM